MEGQAVAMMMGGEGANVSAVSVSAHACEGGKRAGCAMRKEIRGAP